MKSQVLKEFLQVHNSFDMANGSTNSRLATLESQANSMAKYHLYPPHYSHFYFRTVSGCLGEPCLLYSWWRGLITCNADAQGLPTKSALVLAPFVLLELVTLDTFLNLIESHFSSSTEEEDARKAFFALRQGSSLISDFNIQFNTLLYSVNLSPKSTLEHYERAINQKIIKLGIQRGGWSELNNLDDMQHMAVKLSLDVGRVNQINQRKFTVPPPRIKYRVSGSAPVTSSLT
ncbi:uncharacterized protein PGTG_09807 [Puccinia graminis f. sp. tritici CRL 75-36-700-3]|uniref:Retrotransposon gag domain-containing protein n=1 Tax=Puccinia graminis f. sp. tritici (strain CRL 75-36-700-3 / race SCCL) TaxID=418459 RepID=E3KEY7_PUCGT|nr:uncharacterized protein PGTG_09807 [Puccinia graminis f. sp. tritici CRL 75-36-700-3]EFP82839.2 hypothetical protein PGTG_09807 [Puccinia graminis f. sp. tritici CRL 75-36-700-3]